MVDCPNCGKEVEAGAIYCHSCGHNLSQQQEVSANNGRQCYFCGKQVISESEYFHCRYCDENYCSDHRLPENHLCRSISARRVVPTTSSRPYYSPSYYYTSTSSHAGRQSRFLISKQGRNLAVAIIAGLVIGNIFSFVYVDGIALTDYLVQFNALVYQGWLWTIVTSMIVVMPGSLGIMDALLNAVAVIWLDRLLAATYSAKQYYAVFLLTGMAGNLLSLLNGPLIVSFGASGGIFGLIAGAVSHDYAVSKRFNSSLVGWFVIIFVYSSFGGPVDWLAHLGGALLGLLAGYLIGRMKSRVS